MPKRKKQSCISLSDGSYRVKDESTVKVPTFRSEKPFFAALPGNFGKVTVTSRIIL